MSNTDVDPSAGPPPDGSAPTPPTGPQDPSAPPGGGGPVLAALARSRQGAQVSAPGMGNMAQGLMQLKTAVDMLQTALPNLMAGSQQHKDVLNALSRLTRHLPQGAPTAGVQQTQLMDLLRNTVRNALMQKLMGQRGQPPGGPTPGGPPGGCGGEPPATSTPLPGA